MTESRNFRTVVRLKSGPTIASPPIIDTTPESYAELQESWIDLLRDFQPGDAGYVSIDTEEGWHIMPLAEVAYVGLVWS